MLVHIVKYTAPCLLSASGPWELVVAAITVSSGVFGSMIRGFLESPQSVIGFQRKVFEWVKCWFTKRHDNPKLGGFLPSPSVPEYPLSDFERQIVSDHPELSVAECKIVAKMLSACAEFANRLGDKSS